MKKILALLLALVLVLSFSLVSCEELFDEDLFADDDRDDKDRDEKDDEKEDGDDDFYNSNQDNKFEMNFDYGSENYTGEYIGGTIISGSNGTLSPDAETSVVIGGIGGNGSIAIGGNGSIGVGGGSIGIGGGSIGVGGGSGLGDNVVIYPGIEGDGTITTETSIPNGDDEDYFEGANTGTGSSGNSGSTQIPNDQTIVEKYNSAASKIVEADNITITSLQEIRVSLYGFSQNLLTNYITKKYDGDNFLSSNQNSGLGQEATSETVCYVDGTIYKSSSDSAEDTVEQYEGTRNQAIAATGIDLFDEKILVIPESWLADADVFKTESERYYISINLSGEQCLELLPILATVVQAKDITSVNHTIYFGANNEIESIVTIVSMKVNIDQLSVQNLPAEFVSTIVYSNVGTTVVGAP